MGIHLQPELLATCCDAINLTCLCSSLRWCNDQCAISCCMLVSRCRLRLRVGYPKAIFGHKIMTTSIFEHLSQNNQYPPCSFHLVGFSLRPPKISQCKPGFSHLQSKIIWSHCWIVKDPNIEWNHQLQLHSSYLNLSKMIYYNLLYVPLLFHSSSDMTSDISLLYIQEL